MKVVTWNCNGALRKKFEHLSDLNADIYVIQECEDPARIQDKAFHTYASLVFNPAQYSPKSAGLGLLTKTRNTADLPNTTMPFLNVLHTRNASKMANYLLDRHKMQQINSGFGFNENGYTW